MCSSGRLDLLEFFTFQLLETYGPMKKGRGILKYAITSTVVTRSVRLDAEITPTLSSALCFPKPTLGRCIMYASELDNLSPSGGYHTVPSMTNSKS